MFEIISLLGDGLLQSFEPLNLFMIFAGCLAGLFIGAMPGLGSVAILLRLFWCRPHLLSFSLPLYTTEQCTGGQFLQSHWVFPELLQLSPRYLTVSQWLAKVWRIRRLWQQRLFLHRWYDIYCPLHTFCPTISDPR